MPARVGARRHMPLRTFGRYGTLPVPSALKMALSDDTTAACCDPMPGSRSTRMSALMATVCDARRESMMRGGAWG